MDNILTQPDEFDRLGSLSALLLESVESAILSTVEHFIASKHRFNPQFFASHIRSKLREILEPEAANFCFSIVELGTNSFCLVYQEFIIRIYKSPNGMIPPPGESKARLAFYKANGLPSQIVLPGIEPFAALQPTTQAHLIAYYTLDASNRLASLKIAKPCYATSTYVECDWDKEIENPFKCKNNHLDKPKLKVRDDIIYTFRKDDEDDEDDLLELVE